MASLTVFLLLFVFSKMICFFVHACFHPPVYTFKDICDTSKHIPQLFFFFEVIIVSNTVKFQLYIIFYVTI